MRKATKFEAAVDAAVSSPTTPQLKAKMKEITATVRARLGDSITPESLARHILFEAAWSSVQRDTRSLALDYVAAAFLDQHQDLLHTIELAKAMQEAHEKYISYLEPLAKRAARPPGNKRGLSAINSEALAILEREREYLSAKRLFNKLANENADKIQLAGGVLRWKSRTGKPKTTTLKQFENSLSRLRKRLH